MEKILKFGDRVEVTKGFYKGCIGVLTEYIDTRYAQKYEIEINAYDVNNCSRTKIIEIPVKDVEKL